MSNIIPTAPSLSTNVLESFWVRAQRTPLRPLTLPEGFHSLNVDGIKNSFIREIVMDYGKNFFSEATKGIAPFFAGKSGAYKTYGAVVLARAIYERFQITVDFFDCASEFPKIDRLWYEGYAQKRMVEVHKAPVLVVDDFTTLRTGTRDLITFQEIINVRYNYRLPTILTANIDVSQDMKAVEELVGVATARRIEDRSKGYLTFVR
jgi:DNA replication protein DnaC